MEFLSREFDRDEGVYPINLVVQSEQSQEAGYDASKTGLFKRVNLTFDPAEAFHEYRFDYVPGKVIFYADSEILAEMEGGGMPSSGGHLILQHWSNGNPLWSGGPPEVDAALTVSYVKAYFNSSEPQGRHMAAERCKGADDGDEAVCSVGNVRAGNASTGGGFSGNGDEGSGSDGDDDEDNRGPGAAEPALMARMISTAVVLWVLWVGML